MRHIHVHSNMYGVYAPYHLNNFHVFSVRIFFSSSAVDVAIATPGQARPSWWLNTILTPHYLLIRAIRHGMPSCVCRFSSVAFCSFSVILPKVDRLLLLMLLPLRLPSPLLCIVACDRHHVTFSPLFRKYHCMLGFGTPNANKKFFVDLVVASPFGVDPAAVAIFAPIVDSEVEASFNLQQHIDCVVCHTLASSVCLFNRKLFVYALRKLCTRETRSYGCQPMSEPATKTSDRKKCEINKCARVVGRLPSEIGCEFIDIHFTFMESHTHIGWQMQLFLHRSVVEGRPPSSSLHYF